MELSNYNRIYCSTPLRIPLHCKGDSYNAAGGNTKGGFVQYKLLYKCISVHKSATLRFYSSKHIVFARI